MQPSTTTRRPGIVFQTVSPTPPDALPRMDVAGFVGFASRGPIDVPVPVESVARFRDVFGPSVDLVRDPETGQMIRSYLARSVTAFFRNGGQRCWVVRVAENAERRWFVVPGLVDARTGRPATARARSLGSGFDTVRSSTIVRRRSMPAASAWRSGSDWLLAWPVEPEGVAQGTMIRLTRPGDPALDAVEVFLPVERVTTPSGRTPEERAALPVGIGGTVAEIREPFALQREAPEDPPLGGWSSQVTLVDGSAALPPGAPGATSAEVASAKVYVTERGTRIEFDAVVPLPDEGHIVHVEIDASHASLGDIRTIWATVDTARNIEAGGTARSVVTVAEQRWPVDPSSLIPDETLVPSAGDEPWVTEQVSFDLLSWRGDDIQRRLTALQFVETAPRSWTELPVDADLFKVDDGQAVTPPPGTLAADVFDERFALAVPPRDAADPPRLFLPFAMNDRPDPAAARGPEPVAASALRRDGLADFSNALFLDDRLTDATTDSLTRRAMQHLLLPDQPRSRGLHTLWALRDVTLVAVPDAVHRGWIERPVDVDSDIVPIPENLTAVPCANDATILCVSWSPVSLPEPEVPGRGLFGPVRYEVQESTTTDFALSSELYAGTATEAERPITESCSAPLYVRVRARTPLETGPWSETVQVVLPPSFFRAKRDALTPPSVSSFDGDPGETIVQFERVPLDPAGTPDPSGPEIQYDVERAPDPAMERAERIPDGEVVETGARTFEVTIRRQVEPVFVRVRARLVGTGTPGPWSRTVVVPAEALPNVAPISADEYDDPIADTPNRGRNGLLDLQRAMLRFCAARGDVLAVLALPAQDQTDDAQQHVTRLTGLGASADLGPLQIPTLRVSEAHTLSFGAVYHPWPVSSSTQGVVADPPDGAACGVAAQRALQRGAWIAPANVPLDSALALRPNLGPAGLSLLDASINVLSLGPRGVVFEGAATLSPDRSLRPISTRRLLSLLLRLARREGPTLVFESNTLALRRDAAALFDQLLRGLYEQGALAGRTAREAYRVVTDGRVNTPETIERGQLIVEVRVAPAAPLEFILVRLVQRGGQIDATTQPALPTAS